MSKDDTVFVQLRLRGGGTGPHGLCGRMPEFMALSVEAYLKGEGEHGSLTFVKMREHFPRVFYPDMDGGFTPIGDEYYTHTTVAMNTIAAITREESIDVELQ